MTYIDLVMRPNAAIERRMMWRIIVGVAAIMAVGAVRFVLLGAWPVLFFSLLDVGLLAWALNASAKASAQVEEVRLDSQGLSVRRTAQGRGVHVDLFEPRATRVDYERASDRESRLYLADARRRVPIGAFLTVAERDEVRSLLETGLARFRRAGR